MKRNFTRLTSVFMMTMMVTFSLLAQERNTMTITAPISVAGDYEVRTAGFGDLTSTVAGGTLVFADDGDATEGTLTDACQPLVNDLSGSVGLIDRGLCDFVTKCRNAQTAGAIAVLVCNDSPESDPDRGGLLTMADSDPPADDITIPCLFATLETCNIFRAEVANGVDVTFSYVQPECGDFGYPATAVWGAEDGEGNFDGGLNGWTTDTSNGWIWDAEGRLDRGQFNSTQPFIVSPSVCNGAVVFDSDFLDNGGGGPFGSGDCPNSDASGSFVQFCEGSMISPVIDLSGVDSEGFIIQWNQALRQFNSEYDLLLSRDGGSTWADTININTEFVTNSAHFIDNVQRIPVCGFDGEAQFRMRFVYRGNYYYWAIDDVLILNEGFSDPATVPNFVSVATNFKTPASQAEPLAFLSSIVNNGNQDAANTAVTIDILNNATLSTEYSGSQTFGTLDGCGRQDNISFMDTYEPTPGTVMGDDVVYTGTYSVASDANADLTNDEQTFEFRYTENLFSKVRTEEEVGEAYLAAIAPTDGTEYFSLGNHYHVVNGAGLAAKTLTVGLGNDVATDMLSGFVTAQIYRWIDLDDDGAVGTTERILLGEGQEVIFDGSTGTRSITIPLASSQGLADVVLEDNTDYVVMVHTGPISTGGEQWRLLAAEAADEYNYFEMNAATTAAGFPRHGSFFANGSAGTQDDIDERTFGPLFGFSTYADLEIGPSVTSTEDLNRNINISVFPNPADEFVHFAVELLEASDVQIDIVNLEGKLVKTQTYNAIMNDRLTMNISDVPNGVYMANIRTEEGFTSKRIVVQN